MGRNIKQQGISKNSRFTQGIYDQEEINKKIFGPRPIYYRSSYELKYCRSLDLNPYVLQWGSEVIGIPYVMNEIKNGEKIIKRHTYYPDFVVIMKTGKVYIIEIKPFNQTPTRQHQIDLDPTMRKNATKWRAAMNYCKQKGYEFKIVTEKQLKIPLT